MLIVILLHICFAIFLVYWFLRKGRGRREPKRALFEAAGLGMVAIIIALIVEAMFVHGDPPGVNAKAAWTYLGVGAVEELAKLLPLTWLVYGRPYFSEHTDGIIYFGFGGLVFGLVENISYTLSFGTTTGVTRLLLTPYFHAALTAIAGFYIASRKIRRIPMAEVVVVICALIFLHAAYDFGLSSRNLGLILVALVILGILVFGMFWYFRHARKLDQHLALAATHIDTFCPHCGRLNEHQTRFCEFCGQLAST